MVNATWREEKAGAVVKAVCEALISPELPETARMQLEGVALPNALKLYSDAVCDRLGQNSLAERWSVAVVDVFRKAPGKCDQFLELLSKPKFSAEEGLRP